MLKECFCLCAQLTEGNFEVTFLSRLIFYQCHVESRCGALVWDEATSFMSLFGIATYFLMICADTCVLQAANNLHGVTSSAIRHNVCLNYSSSETSQLFEFLSLKFEWPSFVKLDMNRFIRKLFIGAFAQEIW